MKLALLRTLAAFLFFALLQAGAALGQTPPKFPTAGTPTTQFVAGKHGTDDDGHRWAHWYYLSDDGFRWIATWQVLRRDKVLVTVPEVKGESAQTYMARVYRANVPLPCSDTAIKSICDTARDDQAKRPLPEPPAFVVSDKGITGDTRPVRRLDIVTKTLGATIPNKRAPVGAPCMCWAYGVRSGSAAWCPWASAAGDTRGDEVTQCRPLE